MESENEVKEVLQNALKLSKEKYFDVRIANYENKIQTLEKMSYLQLGTLLMIQCESIDYVKIRTKPID